MEEEEKVPGRAPCPGSRSRRKASPAFWRSLRARVVFPASVGPRKRSILTLLCPSPDWPKEASSKNVSPGPPGRHGVASGTQLALEVGQKLLQSEPEPPLLLRQGLEGSFRSSPARVLKRRVGLPQVGQASPWGFAA